MAKVRVVLWSLMTMMCWAINNFLLAVVAKESKSPADANLSGICVFWTTAGLCSLPLLLYQALTVGVLQEMRGKRNAARSYLAGLLSSLGMLVLSVALANDPSSAGPITAVLPLNGVLVCFLAWVVLKEKLSVWQALGVLIAVVGPVLMALSDRSKTAEEGVLCGVISACLLGVSNFLRRSVLARGVKNPTDVQLLVWFAIGTCGALAMAWTYASGRGLKGLDSAKVIMVCVIAGVLWACGSLCFQFALQGPAGPATAIANVNGAGVLVLQILFYHPFIPPLKLVGMALCIFGVSVISLSPKRKQTEPELSAEACSPLQS